MTIEEIYDWAKARGKEKLPAYTWDEEGDELEIYGVRLEAAEDQGYLSDCCEATPDHNFSLDDHLDGVCSECKEHASFSEGLPERVFLKY